MNKPLTDAKLKKLARTRREGVSIGDYLGLFRTINALKAEIFKLKTKNVQASVRYADAIILAINRKAEIERLTRERDAAEAAALERASRECRAHAEELLAMKGADLVPNYGEKVRVERDVRVENQAYTSNICGQRIAQLITPGQASALEQVKTQAKLEGHVSLCEECGYLSDEKGKRFIGCKRYAALEAAAKVSK